MKVSLRRSLLLLCGMFVVILFLRTYEEPELQPNPVHIANSGLEQHVVKSKNGKPNCENASPWSDSQTKWQKIQAANCGMGYDPESDPNKDAPEDFEWKVVLYGKWKPAILSLSGCPIGEPGVCPFSPRCSFQMTKDPDVVTSANVVVALTSGGSYSSGIESSWRKRTSPSDVSQYRVLYMREPSWSAAPDFQEKFDFRMGVLLDSGLNNPLFVRRPHALFNRNHFPFKPFTEKTNFAMSLISNCDASNRRQAYLDHLVGYLGSDRVHQYGKCGDGHQVPRKPITMAAETISSYLFYFAFENSILPGYTTEKLFASLNIGSLPVYLGDPHAIPITTTPSYIDVNQFSTPRALAEYLLYLSKNETAYMEYHAWRSDPTSLTDEYLELVANNFPSANENAAHKRETVRSTNPLRRPLCCRLCNQAELERAKKRQQELKRGEYVPLRWNVDKINSKLFAGKMKQVPDESVDRLPGPEWPL